MWLDAGNPESPLDEGDPSGLSVVVCLTGASVDNRLGNPSAVGTKLGLAILELSGLLP